MKKAYTNKKGLTRFKPVMTAKKFEALTSEGSPGWCLACGTSCGGVEPDARAYTCEKCAEKCVYGLEELLLMGLVVML